MNMHPTITDPIVSPAELARVSFPVSHEKQLPPIDSLEGRRASQIMAGLAKLTKMATNRRGESVVKTAMHLFGANLDERMRGHEDDNDSIKLQQEVGVLDQLQATVDAVGTDLETNFAQIDSKLAAEPTERPSIEQLSLNASNNAESGVGSLIAAGNGNLGTTL